MLGYDCSALRADTSTTVGRWVPRTFAIFECVGDQESSDPRLADAEHGGQRLYVDRLPLIPTEGMSAIPGTGWVYD